MKELWSKYRSLFFYLVFGALTTLVNIVTYHLCYEVWQVANVPSNIIAWVLSVAVAYLTNKVWVFGSKNFSPTVVLPELSKFAAARLATGGLDLIIMWVGVDLIQGPATPIKIASNAVVILLNYVCSKVFIFGSRE